MLGGKTVTIFDGIWQGIRFKTLQSAMRTVMPIYDWDISIV